MRSEWENDNDWKVHTTDKRIYIMREHNWAFAAWEISKIEGRIKEKSLVVHVDSHLDDVPDGVLVKNLLTARTPQEILEVSKSYDRSLEIVPESNLMQIENFIWASLARGTIEEVIYVSRDDQEVTTLNELRESGWAESKLMLSKLPPNCNYRHQRYHSISSFLESFDGGTFAEFVSNRSVILDLDIDVFNESDYDPILTPMHEVRESIERLLNLYQWDIITIAISPYYCGGALEAELILENVLKVMNIDLSQTHKW